MTTPESESELDTEETVIVEVERVPDTVMTTRDVTVEWLVERPSDEYEAEPAPAYEAGPVGAAEGAELPALDSAGLPSVGEKEKGTELPVLMLEPAGLPSVAEDGGVAGLELTPDSPAGATGVEAEP